MSINKASNYVYFRLKMENVNRKKNTKCGFSGTENGKY